MKKKPLKTYLEVSDKTVIMQTVKYFGETLLVIKRGEEQSKLGYSTQAMLLSSC